MAGTFIVAIVFFAAIVGLFMFLYYFPLGLWIRTIAAGVPLSMMALIRMRLIGIQPGVIVTNLVRARKAGLDLTVDQMQSHYLAGGNVEKVTLAMIAAQRAEIPLTWQRASAIDLAGRDVLDALGHLGQSQGDRNADLSGRRAERHPAQRQGANYGAHQFGQLRRRRGRADDRGARRRRRRLGDRRRARPQGSARVSRPHLEGRAGQGLDAGTAFQIVSIDIADVDVGKNIGAELQTAQAEADRRIAQAKAAERQYSALAAEQEQKAETQAMRAKVVEAEAQIPEAIAEAFRSGNLGVMDYYKLNNIKADTEMRGAISTGVTPPEQGGGTPPLQPPKP
jgi:uncharacterized protein YqfA (UPF0365 family)